MRKVPLLSLATVAGLLLLTSNATPAARAQVAVSIGVAPVCPYGYYDYAPYTCAPAGYYGPEWFSGGVFIGAGPWFHGPANFHGHVDNRFDPHHGYHGPTPHPNDRYVAEEHQKALKQFHGNEEHDGHGEHEEHGGSHPGGR
jgi:hypothetical protein